MLLHVQVLRAVAALLVLAFHVQHDLVRRLGFEGYPLLHFGAAGVDIFFVISGFIMVWASRGLFGQPGAARQFLLRRLVRIVPLYWATTLLFLVVIVVMPPLNGRQADPAHLLASLLFLPWPDQDGAHSPFYGIGWTLNYEMLFYLCFALVLGAAPRRAVLMLSAAFALLAVLGVILPSLPFALRVWSQPLILEFVAGAGLAIARLEGVSLPRAARIGLVLLGSALLVATEWLPVPTTASRALVWGVPAALIMAGAVLGPERPVRGAFGRVLVLMGDASYSLYLVHFFVIAGIRPIAMRVPEIVALSPVAYALALAALSIAASILVHLAFERPVHRALLARIGARSGSRPVARATPGV